MHNAGDVVLTAMPFVDACEIKKRPAVILYKELGNIVVAGITSNPNMKGIKIRKKEGAIEDCIIKLNYIFTISSPRIIKKLFSLSKGKQKQVYREIILKLRVLE